MRLASWRVALRIARREALRSRGRSVLVITMIGLPILALSFAAVVVRTAQLPYSEVARRELGAADLRVQQVSVGQVTQSDPRGWSYDGVPLTPEQTGTREDLLRRLPRGSQVSALRSSYALRLRVDDRVVQAETREVPFADPIVDGMFRLRFGQVPEQRNEVALSPSLMEAVGVEVGGTVATESPRRTLTVTGVIVTPGELGGRGVFSAPGADLIPEQTQQGDSYRSWLVDLPHGARDLDVMRALNAQGYGVVPRSWILDPPPVSSDMIDPAAAGVVVVAVGLAALEIILLAGAAFAVGARRRTRELGVLQATGADRGDVVRVVLGGGVVLGLVAGLVGILGGIAAVFLLRPRLDEVNGALLGPLDLRPLELAAIVGVAVGTAVLAALLPARAASRTAVVAALTGRRGQVRTPRRVPALGLLAIVVGGLVAFWAAGSGIVPVSQSAGPGGGVTPAGRPAHFNLLLLGAVVAELGFVTCAPALVGLVGRLAHRMPLALRLALRDAARHRTRSGPAVAAVVAAVAGSIAVSVYIASDTDRQRRSYQASLPLGVVEVQESDYNGEQLSAADRAAVLAALPAREEIAVGTPWCRESPTPCHQWSYELPEARKCPDYTDPGSDPRCRRFLSYGSLAVAGPELVTAITGRADRAVSDAMAAGHAIVFDDAYVENGMVVVTTEMYADPSRPPGPPVKVDAARPVPTTASQAPTPAPSRAQPRVRRQRVPAIAVTAPTFGMRPGIVIPPALARTIGLPAKRTSTWLTTTRLPTDDEIERARGAARNSSISVYAERGFQGQSGLALLALLGATTLVTLGATGIATGLAAADSRPDLATLAAVGAAPRVRRVLAMAQAATVAGLGSALGVLAGLVPAVAVIAARSEFDLVLPWPALGATIVGVPLVAALLVGAVSRSRLPLERRMA